MVDIQLRSEEISKEFNTQQLAELCFHVSKSILRHITSFNIQKEYKNEVARTIKALKKYFDRLSLRGVNLFQEKPSRDMTLISLICYTHSYEADKENLEVSLIEFNLSRLSEIHPRLSLTFLDLFMRESMQSLKGKWKYVPSHSNLPSLCLAKVRRLNSTLHKILSNLELSHLRYSNNIAFIVIQLERKS